MIAANKEEEKKVFCYNKIEKEKKVGDFKVTKSAKKKSQTKAQFD